MAARMDIRMDNKNSGLQRVNREPSLMRRDLAGPSNARNCRERNGICAYGHGRTHGHNH
jgi:hypothetical protein